MYDDSFKEVLAGLPEVGDEDLLQFFCRVINDIYYMDVAAPRLEGGVPSDSSWRLIIYGDEIRGRGLIEKLGPVYRKFLER